MPILFERSKKSYASLDHFKEMAVKRINETYGRKTPLDVFDFSETKDKFKCVAYYDHEQIPDEKKEGEELTEEEKYSLSQVQSASDAAMKLAADNDVDIDDVTGTGADGNVKVDDVRDYIKARDEAAAAANQAQADEETNNAPLEDNADNDTENNIEQ